jgi:hypothetical protein
MNLFRYRRNLVIIVGMIIINIATQIFIDVKGCDFILGCSYFSLNTIWISILYMSTKDIIEAVDNYF